MSRRIVKTKPGSKPLDVARRAQIDLALAQGDIKRAAEVAESALAAGRVDPMVLNLAAWQREEDGDFRGAHELLEQALRLSPGDVLVAGSIGAVLRKEGRNQEALAVLDQVLASEPRHSAAWLERGYTLEALREDQAAVQSYRNALALDPGLAPALGKLADLAAKRGDREAGRTYAERALALDPAQASATFALATIALEEGAAKVACDRLSALLETPLRGDDRTRTLTLLGDAFEKQGQPDEAFATWERAQSAFREHFGPVLAPVKGRPSHRRFIEAITERVEQAPAMVQRSGPGSVPGAASRHVFLLGYPRSGTTLVENILASAPGVVALEERDTLRDTDEALIPNDGQLPDLDALDAGTLARLRAAYWSRVREMAGTGVSDSIFVDMNPFNGIKLPVIARLFPEARILVMRRDPRDVVLSCFRINFSPSAAAYAFSELEETARHYDALMRLIGLCREKLPLAVHEVRYDRLVNDFEAEVRAMAAFIGLEWTEAFRTFDRTAQARGVRTASATQVRRGLYDGGGRWRRYERQLAPILPILQPWVERFGFES